MGFMTAAEIMARWRPGSYEERWSWHDERRELEEYNGLFVRALAYDIQAYGIKEPVLLGDDGRVWDGHHRILLAERYGLPVPVEIVESHVTEKIEIPVCRECIEAHVDASLIQVLFDDQPRRCAICGELRQPLYALWVQPTNFTHD